MTPALLNQFADLTNLQIQKMFKKAAGLSVNYSKYYNVRTTTDEIDKDSSLSGLAEAEFTTTDNGVITEDAPIQGFSASYTQQSVDLLVTLSYRLYKFGLKKRKLEFIADEIQKALNRKKEKLAAERITNGQATAYTHVGVGKNTSISLTGGDGYEPWKTTHTREDGGTSMNNVVYDGTTYSLPFGYSGLKAAHRTASLFVDPRGNPMETNLNLLICKDGSSVHFKAMEILGAIKNGKIPESNDNDASGVRPFSILPLKYLTTDALWAMTDSSMMNDEYGFQHIESEANNVDNVNVVYKTREMQWAGHTIFTQGFNDVARSWVFSLGDSLGT